VKQLMVVVMVSLFIAGCPAKDPVFPTPDVKDTDLCGEAEVNIVKLQCRDRRGDPLWVNRNGEEFEDTCRIVQDQGGVYLNPECIRDATSCAEVLACPTVFVIKD